VLASKQLARLRSFSVANFEFTGPFTPEGVLEIRVWNRSELANHAKHLALLPEGCVTKVLIRPRFADPWEHSGVAPEDAQIEALRAATKIPVEVAWH
jgi:hypothetical protein